MKLNKREFNYPYSQRGLNTVKSVLNQLEVNKNVSIIWDNIPKIHLKAIKEIVKDLNKEDIAEIRIDNLTTPAHTNYYL